jgi:hypothetical protein
MTPSLAFHPADPFSLAAFLAICLLVVVLFLRTIWLSAQRKGIPAAPRTAKMALAVAVWLGLLAAVVASGFVTSAPSHLPLFAGGVLAVTLVFGLSDGGDWVGEGSSVAALVAFQGFRLPLELVLHSWAKQGVIPETMTWTGQNWDILSGIVALTLAPFARRSRAAAWVANLIGIVLLLNVARVALLSSPVPFGWKDVTPKLLLMARLPYALIFPVCVGGALLGHVMLTRVLLKRGAPKPAVR